MLSVGVRLSIPSSLEIPLKHASFEVAVSDSKDQPSFWRTQQATRIPNGWPSLKSCPAASRLSKLRASWLWKPGIKCSNCFIIRCQSPSGRICHGQCHVSLTSAFLPSGSYYFREAAWYRCQSLRLMHDAVETFCLRLYKIVQQLAYDSKPAWNAATCSIHNGTSTWTTRKHVFSRVKVVMASTVRKHILVMETIKGGLVIR